MSHHSWGCANGLRACLSCFSTTVPPDSWGLCMLGCDPLHADVGWTHSITQHCTALTVLVCGQHFKGRDKTCVESAQGPGGTGVQFYLRHRPWLIVVKGESGRGGLRGHGQDQDMGGLSTLTKPCCSGDERKGLHCGGRGGRLWIE